MLDGVYCFGVDGLPVFVDAGAPTDDELRALPQTVITRLATMLQLWENWAVLHHTEAAESVNRNDGAAMQALGQLAASGQGPEQASAIVNRLLDQQAYTTAVTDAFCLSSVLFVALIDLVRLTNPRRSLAAVADAGGAH